MTRVMFKGDGEMVKVYNVKKEGEKPSVIMIYKDESTDVVFQTYDFRAPYPEELKKALEISGLWELGVKLNHKRKNPYKVVVREGVSGCKDFFVAYGNPLFEEFTINKTFRIKRTHALHVSMYGKLNKQTYAWLGDLVAVLEHLELDTTKVETKELKTYNLEELLEQGFKIPNLE